MSSAPVTPSEALFQEVVEKLGLSMIIGPGLVKRCLTGVGADWSTATPRQYTECLVQLEQRLSTYVGAESAATRIAEIRRVLLAHRAG